jgi:hypothetical protein
MRVNCLVLIAALVLNGCTERYADGAIATRDQAAAIADRNCRELNPAPHKRWAVNLKNGIWHVWKRHGGVRVDVWIDAKTGSTGDASCVWTPDDG